MDPRQAVALVLDRMDAAVRRAGPEFVELEKRLRLQLQLERANQRIAELEAKIAPGERNRIDQVSR